MASAPQPFASTARGRRTDLSFIGIKRAINQILKCLDDYGDKSMDGSSLAALYFQRLGITKRQFISQHAPARTPGGVHMLSPKSQLKKGIRAIEDDLKKLVVPLDKLGTREPEFLITGDERTKRENLIVWYRIYEAAMAAAHALKVPEGGRERIFEEKQAALQTLKKLVQITNSHFERLGPHSRLRPMLAQIRDNFCFHIPGTDIIVFEGISIPMADAAASSFGVADTAAVISTANPVATASTTAPALFKVDVYLKSEEPITLAAACKVFGIEEAILVTLAGDPVSAAAATGSGAAGTATASYETQITAQYRKLAITYHPDKGEESHNAFTRMKALHDLIAPYGNNPKLLAAAYQFETTYLPELEQLMVQLKQHQTLFAEALATAAAHGISTTLSTNLKLIAEETEHRGAAALFRRPVDKTAVETFCREHAAAIDHLESSFDEAEAAYRELEDRYQHIADKIYEGLKHSLYSHRIGSAVDSDADSDDDAATEELINTTLARLLLEWESPIRDFNSALTAAATHFNTAKKDLDPVLNWEAHIGRTRDADKAVVAAGSAAAGDIEGSTTGPTLREPSGRLAHDRKGRTSGSSAGGGTYCTSLSGLGHSTGGTVERTAAPPSGGKGGGEATATHGVV